jgi:hypothetical protein
MTGFSLRLCLTSAIIVAHHVSGEDLITLQFKKSGNQGEVGVHSQMELPVSAMYPEYSIYRSTNMVDWELVAGPINGGVGVSDEFLRAPVALEGDRALYRVMANVKLAPPGGANGHTIYGYGTEFSRQLQSLGQLSLGNFESLYTPTNQYLAQISFDPTTIEFWNQFNQSNLALNTNEFSAIQTNGFVVSERLGSYSFADAFYTIFTNDLPVYFSADAALHAWHRSYAGMLQEVEETYLAPTLQTILESMGAQVGSLWSQSVGTALPNGVSDADYFIAVARSLITGTNDYGALGQNAQILATLSAIDNLQPGTAITMFGTNRGIDCSQFQVRGHYETSERLKRYFRAMMWCGLADFRYTGSTNDNSARELSGAVAMHLLLQNSGQYTNWKRIDDVAQMFVGAPDSLNFAQLNDLLTTAGILSPANLPNTAALQALQAQLMTGQLGMQHIANGHHYSPLSAQQLKLPRSFTMLGQRFVPDSWAMGQCVFDRILWDENGIAGVEDKVIRRVPSALDIAFAVLGNNQTVPEITARIANPGGHPWRDGKPYQHNLAALRETIDLQNESAWTNNIYNSWLGCLRELSAPTTEPQYPDAMRTWAWAMKTLNTQLASWTELRHDTVLYAKQSYSPPLVCSYPDGFIEPRPGFWLRMKDMALRTKALVSTLPNTGQFTFEPNIPELPWDLPFTVSMGWIYTNRLQYLDNFASNLTVLHDISIKELNRQTLSSNETFFIQSLIENPTGYSGGRTYTGWYPTMFYYDARAYQNKAFDPLPDKWDALVTDVHTDLPDQLVGDPGSVLHQGVGNVHLLMMAVNWAPGDACVYAGPVLSHYEFELPSGTRKTDSQWKTDLQNGIKPPLPNWTQSYLVPGNYVIPPWAH